MFAYYFDLALRSFRRNRILTALMVLAIALGIGASMTTLTIFHVLSGEPNPQKSDRLFTPQLDPATMNGYTAGEEPDDQMTRYDAEELLRQKHGLRQAMMTGGSVAVEPQKAGLDAFYVDARYNSADFFQMFDTPFLYGSGWSATEDQRRDRVVVLARELNDKVFGGANSVGKTIRMNGNEMRVVGVLDKWRPAPKFYDVNSNRFGEPEQAYIPFSTSRELKLDRNGSMNCWDSNESDDPEGETGVNAPCSWIQYWVELDSPAKADEYLQYLRNYSDQQRANGRYQRPTNVRLRNVMQWLDYQKVVPGDVRMQVWLAFGFLLVCLLNTVGLLLAKFRRRSSEIGVRRALGASRRAIFAQCLVEAGTVGLAGGILGLALAWLGLWAIRQQPTGFADLIHLDVPMLATTFVLAIAASVLAGLVPAWQACQVTPAMQLKSQ
ncbi:MAG: ABC transporter permease [Luteimonas sp.]